MSPEHFEVSIPDEEIDDLQRRLRSTRWSQDFANSGWRYGTNGDYLAELVDCSLHEYDWRATERAINSVSQWRTEIDGVPVHFVHERGQGPVSASHHPEPRLALDLLGLPAAPIGPLSDPAAYGGDPSDAFDVVVPSLPGFGFSSPLTRTGINASATGDLWRRG